MVLVSHIFNTLDLSPNIVFDSLSTDEPNLSMNNSVNKRPTVNMLPQYVTLLNSNNLHTNDDSILRHNTSLPTNIMSFTDDHANSSTNSLNNIRHVIDCRKEQYNDNILSVYNSTTADNENRIAVDLSKTSSNHHKQLLNVSYENRSSISNHLHGAMVTTDVVTQLITPDTRQGQNKPLHSRSQSVTSTENFHKEFSSRTLSQSNQRISETNNQFDFDQNDVGNYSFFKPPMVNTSTPRELTIYQDKDDFNLNMPVPQQQSDESELLLNRNSSFSNLLREIQSLQGSNLNCETSREQSSDSSPMTSSSKSQTNAFDPVAALANPASISKRILEKCKQFLLSTSPVITRTCWNRRFGGDANLCHQATQLLLTADLFIEGQFAACSTKLYPSWIKKLPMDPTNAITTLNFQQKKLNIFGITWSQYVSSFQRIEFGHSRSSGLISQAAAAILRSKPYTDIGFILDETIVFDKKEKKSNVSHRQDRIESPNLRQTSVPDIHMGSFSEQENSTIPIVAQSLPISDSSNIPLQSTSFGAAPIETSFNNSISKAPPTPKRTRRELSPMRTRSKSRRLDK